MSTTQRPTSETSDANAKEAAERLACAEEETARPVGTGWVRSAILQMETQVGIGALNLPTAMDKVGLLPGVILLFVVASMTTWSNFMIGKYKLAHPEVYGLEDIAFQVCGRGRRGSIAKKTVIVVYQLYWVFVVGSAHVTISTGFNAISDHGACTATFVAVAAIIGFVLASIPTMSKVGYAAYPGIVCVLVALLTAAIAVSLQDRPAAAPAGPWAPDWQLVGSPSFAGAMSAVSTFIFAFSGTPAFCPIMHEIKKPKDHFKSMFLCQAVVTITYLIIAVTVHYYCGSYVASPALGSAGPLLMKACYGIALPGLIVTAMIVTHVPAKTLIVLFTGTPEMIGASVKRYLAWFGCTGVVTIIGYLIASAIPGFDVLVSFIGAFLETFLTITPFGAMWLSLYWNDAEKRKSSCFWFGVVWATSVIVIGFFCQAAGTHGSVVAMMDAFKAGTSTPWSCENTA